MTNVDIMEGQTITIEADFDTMDTTITLFDRLMTAVQMRQLTFDENDTLIEGVVTGKEMQKRINDNWDEILALDQGDHALTNLAHRIEELAENSDMIGW